MPILGSHMQRSAALVVLCIHSCPILEQCADDLIEMV